MAIRRLDRPPFRADIVVYDPDGIRMELIAEVKARQVANLDEESRPLREAMLSVGCHNGLLVTPESMYVFRDSLDLSPNAVKPVARLDTARMLGQSLIGRDSDNERELATAVASWLQAASDNWSAWFASLPADDEQTAELLPEFVGAVANGQVRREVTI